MKVTDIPHFKQVVIMATNCDSCGFRESEVKGGAGIEDKGKLIDLKVTTPRDLHRDLLKVQMTTLKFTSKFLIQCHLYRGLDLEFSRSNI